MKVLLLLLLVMEDGQDGKGQERRGKGQDKQKKI